MRPDVRFALCSTLLLLAGLSGAFAQRKPIYTDATNYSYGGPCAYPADAWVLHPTNGSCVRCVASVWTACPMASPELGDPEFDWDATENTLNVTYGAAGVLGKQTVGEPLNSTFDRLCWDVTGDATCDWFYDRNSGLIAKDGMPLDLSRVAIFSTTHDMHEQDGDGTCDPIEQGAGSDGCTAGQPNWPETWARRELIDACHAHGFSCGLAISKNPADATFGWSAASLQYATDRDQTICTHTASHCYWGMDSDEWAPGYDNADGSAPQAFKGLNNVGEVNLTAGGTQIDRRDTDADGTIDATESRFDRECRSIGAQATNWTFAPVGASMAVDTDGDGTVEWTGQDWEGRLSALTDETNQRLTVTPALPALGSLDCDRDGTFGEGNDNIGCRFEIRTSFTHWKREFGDAVGDTAGYTGSLVKSGFPVRCYSAPGNAEGGHGAPTQAGASFDMMQFNATGEAPGLQVVGTNVNVGAFAHRISPHCKTTIGAIEKVVDALVDARATSLWGGHTPMNTDTNGYTADDVASRITCTTGSDSWDIETFDAFLDRILVHQQAGKAIYAPPEVAGRLAQLKALVDNNRNMLVNGRFQYADDVLETHGFGVADHEYWPWSSATPTTDTTSTDFDGDGTTDGVVVSTTSAGTILQRTRAAAGRWAVSALVQVKGNATARLCVTPSDGPAEGLARTVMPSVWWVEHVGTVAHMNNGTTPGCSSNITTTGTNTVNRWVMGQFHVPPELEGAPLVIRFDWDAVAGQTAGFAFVTLARWVGDHHDSKYGGIGPAPTTMFSQVPGDLQSAYTGAFVLNWDNENSGGDASTNYRVATPTIDLFRINAGLPTFGSWPVFTIGKTDVDNSSAGWIAEGSPYMHLGYSSSTVASRSAIILGSRLSTSGKYLSLMMRGTTNAAAEFWSNYDGTTGAEASFDWLGINAATTFGSRLFRVHAGSSKGVNERLVVHGDGAVSMPYTRLGSTSTTAADGLCVRQKSTCDTSVECAFFDFDCDNVVDAGVDFCLKAAGVVDGDCL